MAQNAQLKRFLQYPFIVAGVSAFWLGFYSFIANHNVFAATYAGEVTWPLWFIAFIAVIGFFRPEDQKPPATATVPDQR